MEFHRSTNKFVITQMGFKNRSMKKSMTVVGQNYIKKCTSAAGNSRRTFHRTMKVVEIAIIQKSSTFLIAMLGLHQITI